MGFTVGAVAQILNLPVHLRLPDDEDIASDSTKFYADPMGGNPNSSYQCTSAANPSPTDLVNIFATIGNHLTYTQLLPLTTQ